MPHYRRNIRFILFLVLPLLAFLLGWSLNQQYSHRPVGPVAKEEKSADTELANFLKDKITIPIHRKTEPRDVDLKPLWETWNVMEGNFLYQDRFKTQDQVYGAIKGLVNSLKDPYTVFLTPQETKEFDASISGEFEGIGAEITVKNDQLTIVSPLKGTPADLSGLRPGDVIYKIDGDQTFGMSVTEAVVKIRGPQGEKVVLEVIREGEPNPFEVTIVRDTIIVKNLEWEMNDEIAYLEVTQFGSDLMQEFNEAVNEILLENPKGLVVDLRNNGGGLLDMCLEFADEFFRGKQAIVKTRGRRTSNEETFISTDGGSFVDLPLVVITNQGSASASEIFAGAVADLGRGVIVGETTFGKGSVQNLIPMASGASLKITIAEWLTPNGNSINEAGIEPDEQVKLSRDDYENDLDPVKDRAFAVIRDEATMRSLLEKRASGNSAENPEANEETTEETNEAAEE